MDYKEKYYKYKKKYLKLKNQYAGSSLKTIPPPIPPPLPHIKFKIPDTKFTGILNFVSGPISFRHLKHKDNGKNLYIFGDRHESNANMCYNLNIMSKNNHKLLHFFINDIIQNNKDIEFDIGIEQGHLNKRNALHIGPMTQFDNYFSENILKKKYSNLRLHFLDIRNLKKIEIFGMQTTRNHNKTVEQIKIPKENDIIIQEFDNMQYMFNKIYNQLKLFGFAPLSIIGPPRQQPTIPPLRQPSVKSMSFIGPRQQPPRQQPSIPQENKKIPMNYSKKLNIKFEISKELTTKGLTKEQSIYKMNKFFNISMTDLYMACFSLYNTINSIISDSSKYSDKTLLTYNAKETIFSFKTKDEKVGIDFTDHTNIIKICKLDYSTKQQGDKLVCIYDEFNKQKLMKMIIHKIKKIKKIAKLFKKNDLDSEFLKMRIISYINIRVDRLFSNIYINTDDFIMNIKKFEKNLENVSDIINKNNYNNKDLL